MAKKTWNEKLNSPGDLPLIKDVSDKPDKAWRMGGNLMLIAAPMQYHEVMAKVPEGRLTTADRIRAHLAKEAGADLTCPLTAGIFINIAAQASAERAEGHIPYWRTLKAGGELNVKYPEGIEGQRLRLEMEGHEVIQKGKRWFVADYEGKIADL